MRELLGSVIDEYGKTHQVWWIDPAIIEVQYAGIYELPVTPPDIESARRLADERLRRQFVRRRIIKGREGE